MMEYNYVQIGNRIRSEREKLNLSQENFLYNIREKNKPCIGRNTLSKLENGDEKAFNGINIAQLIAMCEEFNCSISFLLGEYEYRNYDNKFICEQTDLSENNLNKITRNKNAFLNTLIASKQFFEIDYAFDQMQQAIHKINQCVSDLKQLEDQSFLYSKDDPSYKEIDKMYFEIVSNSEKIEGQISYNIYKMGLEFGNAIEDAKKQGLKNISNNK